MRPTESLLERVIIYLLSTPTQPQGDDQMAYEIKKIHLYRRYTFSPDNIVEVELSNGEKHSRQMVIDNINRGDDYYYLTPDHSRATLEAVYPTYEPPFIRTKGNKTMDDELFSLPIY
jgi:hypothetical protein